MYYITALVFFVSSVSHVEMGTMTKKTYLTRRQDIPESESSKPVIGVLAQETSGRYNTFAQGQYVLSTYVTLLESVGARVIPVLVNQTAEEIENIFNSINGLLIPGGHVKLQFSMYGKVGKQFFDLAIKANDKGDVFPIWAECLGLELIALLVSGRGLREGQYDTKLFEDVDAKYLFLPLTLVGDWKKSKIFGKAPPDMVDFMTKKLKGFHNHDKALTMKEFKKYTKLSKMFNVFSINKDRKGKEYISTMEGKKYPFWLLHWHPSKASNIIPEGYDSKAYEEAMTNAKYLYTVFVDEARKSKHKFSTNKKLSGNLISQYPLLMPLQSDVFGIGNIQDERK